MTSFDPWFWVAIAAISVAGSAWRVAAISRHTRRMNHLAVAKHYAEVHKTELKYFLASETPSDDLKVILLSVSDMLFNKSMMIAFAKWVIEQPHLQPPEAGSFDLAAAVEELRNVDPQNAARFHRALGSGMVAAFHRWPETSVRFDAFATQAMADPDQEAQLVASAAVQRFRSVVSPLDDARKAVPA